MARMKGCPDNARRHPPGDHGLRLDLVTLGCIHPDHLAILQTMVTRRVAAGVVWTPFHFGGFFRGEDLLDKYPAGAAPYVRGDACNTAFTYGYDSVTQMQETKVTLCQVSAV